MKALWLEGGELSVRDVEALARPGEALVKVRLSGICGTDLELVRGYYPYTGVPGHEFVGEVAESPDPNWQGRRVVAEINAHCGACPTCRAGRPTHCENRSVVGIVARDGAHAQYLSVPLGNLLEVPVNVPDEAAVFAEPLAAAVEILEQVHVRPSDRVLLIGAGRLGQMVARVMALTGAHFRVVARHPHQMAMLEACGAQTIDEAGIAENGWDIVIEATGAPSGFKLARRAVRPRGTFVLKSTYAGDSTVDLSSLVVDEVTVVGSRCGPFAPAMRLLESGLVDPTPLISARFKLTDAVEAMRVAAESSIMKVLLEP